MKGRFRSAALILTPFPSRLHHHPTTNSVKGVGHQPRDGCHRLGNHPAHNNVHVLGIRQHPCGQSQEAKWPRRDSSLQLSKTPGGGEDRLLYPQLQEFWKNLPLVKIPHIQWGSQQKLVAALSGSWEARVLHVEVNLGK